MLSPRWPGQHAPAVAPKRQAASREERETAHQEPIEVEEKETFSTYDSAAGLFLPAADGVALHASNPMKRFDTAQRVPVGGMKWKQSERV